MPVTKIVNARKDFERAVEEARDALEAGLLVVLPTETVYGLAAHYRYRRSVEKVFIVKNRPPEPLTIHFAKLDDVEDLVTNPHVLHRVWGRLWPGPLTLVLPATSGVPRVVTQGRPCVGLRAPAHPLTLKVLELAGPVVMPSANVSGRPSPSSGWEAILEMFGRADLVIDAGECVEGLESTIVDLCSSPPRVLRLGPLRPEEISSLLGVSLEISGEALRSARRKYSIAAKLVFVEGDPSNPRYVDRVIEVAKEAARRYRVCVLCRDSHLERYRSEGFEAIGFGERDVEAARRIYAALRLAEVKNCEVVVAECLADEGLGRAVNSRLRSAAWRVVKVF